MRWKSTESMYGLGFGCIHFKTLKDESGIPNLQQAADVGRNELHSTGAGTDTPALNFRQHCIFLDCARLLVALLASNMPIRFHKTHLTHSHQPIDQLS